MNDPPAGAALVVAKIDRLSRDVDDGRYVLKALNNRLRSCDIPGDIDKFSLTMYLAFAERERELISIRTSQALQAKIKNTGKWQVTHPDFQNGTIGRRGVAVIKRNALENENNKRAAASICDKLKAGMKIPQIVEHLNAPTRPAGASPFLLSR